MRYKDFDGSVEDLVQMKLKEIEEKENICPPPVLFQKLVDDVLEENIKPVVSDLLRKKIQMAEADRAPRIDALNDYIESNLEHFKQLAASMADDRNSDWIALNEVFIHMLSNQ